MDVTSAGPGDPATPGHQPWPDRVPAPSLEDVQAAALTVDDDGVIVSVNGAAESLLHRARADFVGQDAHDLLHRDSHGDVPPRTHCRPGNALRDRRTEHGDRDWFARGDGVLVRLAWCVTPYSSGHRSTGALVLLYEREESAPEEDLSGAPESMTELDRLTLLAETTTQLTSTLDTDEALHRLAVLTVPRLADWAVIDLIAERDEVRRALVVEYKDSVLIEHEDLQGPMPPIPEESPMPLSRALRGAASSLAGPAMYQGPPDSGIAVEQRRLFAETGIHSAVIAPIRGLRDTLGALTLGRSQRPTAFTAADLPLLEDITRRAGLALDNARLYQRQRKVAETMQRHLLPQLPTVPGVDMAVRYVPAPHASSVGGDWYDAFALTDSTHALVIGDVVGHDLDAAAGMAQVRSILRAYAWTHHDPPSAIVNRLDESAMHIAGVSMATLVFGILEQTGDGAWHLAWTNAGHPPPLLITHDGQARYLTEGHGLLLSTGLTAKRTDTRIVLPPQSTLVLYTDGLVESRDHSIDDGLERLRKHAASLVHRPLAAFTDLLLERARPVRNNDDDIAILALRTPAAHEPSPPQLSAP